MNQQKYPDLTEIIARKQRGRRAFARLSFAQKLDILDRLRENEMSLSPALRQAAAHAHEKERS